MIANRETSTSVDEVEIERLRDSHITALNASDVNAWADCFTDDGIQISSLHW